MNPNPSHLWELRAAWLSLGVPLLLVLPWQGPAIAALTLVPWVAGGALLLRPRSGTAILGAFHHLGGGPVGRMSLLAGAILLFLVALLTEFLTAILVLLWGALAAMAIGLRWGAGFLSETFQRAVMVASALALVVSLLEGVLNLDFFVRRFGSPAELLAWERRYDDVERRNIFGFRTRHQTLARTPGTRRIVTIGDSFTWGDKVASTDSVWPARLEAELARRYPEWPTEVVNLSRRGWGTVEEAAALDRLGWQFQPDRVVIQFYENDAVAPRGEPGLGRPLRQGADPTSQALWRRSAVVWVVKRIYQQWTRSTELFASYQDGHPGWAALQAGFRQIGKSARDHGVPVTLVIFPAFMPGSWTTADYPLRQIHQKVIAAAKVEGFDIVDLTAAYAAEGGDWKRWWATPNDRHPSAAAHLVAARAIAAHLAQHGWGAAHEPAASEARR